MFIRSNQTSMCLDPHVNEGWGWRLETGLGPPIKYFSDRSKAILLLPIICVIYVCLFHAFASVDCCLVVTFWKRAGLLALICDI